MTDRGRFCLDTNIFVRAVDRDSGDWHEYRLPFCDAMI